MGWNWDKDMIRKGVDLEGLMEGNDSKFPVAVMVGGAK